jgi:hypothetical protein
MSQNTLLEKGLLFTGFIPDTALKTTMEAAINNNHLLPRGSPETTSAHALAEAFLPSPQEQPGLTLSK